MCKFSCYGRGTVRDSIYEKRASLARSADGQRRDPSDQLFVNEVLSQQAFMAMRQLRAAKKEGLIHSVFTTYGHIFVRTKQHGVRCV